MTQSTLSVSGTRLLLDGQHFPFQGLSFFNALYNPTFNHSPDDRAAWMMKFRATGINALRVWCQWDYTPPRSFVDTGPDQTLYSAQGDVIENRYAILVSLLDLADGLDMTTMVTLFSHEKEPNLPIPALERAAGQMVRLLKPHRNLLLQVWNEDSTHILRLIDIIRAEDASRVVTSAPGFSDDFGDDAQNAALDALTPHTNRQSPDGFWNVAPGQLETLLRRWNKPVIDDEPARNGIAQFGGRPDAQPWQHIEQIKRVRALGGYHVYHHDMFQLPYGSAATPPHGIPDPDFSPYHRQVFDYLRDNPGWAAA
ncbi:MAG: hypothetical protein ABIQ99_15905 [Thermoflexales bacterium]